MSSGAGLLLIPLAVILAAPVAAAAGVGMAAVLLARACGGATAAGAGQVVRLADEISRHRHGQRDAERNALLWGLAAREVVELNAAIRLLRRRAGVDVTLPEPLAIEGHTVQQIDEWLRASRRAVAAARVQVERDAIAASRGALLRELVSAGGAGREPHDLLAEHETTLLRRLEAAPAKRPAAGADRTAQLHDRVSELLASLDVDVLPAERDRALSLAARATATTSLVYLPTYVESLRRHVSESNEAAAGRRRADQWLQVLEHAVVADADPKPTLLTETAAKLARVLSGEARLDARLEHDAARALECVTELGRARHVRELVERCLIDRNYRVLDRFTTGTGAGVTVDRVEWHGEHRAKVVIDGQTITAGLLENPDVADVVADLRCDDFADDLEQVPRQLREKGATEAELIMQRRRGGPPDDHRDGRNVRSRR